MSWSKTTFNLTGAVFLLLYTFTTSALADEPGRGRTGPFEVRFLQFTIDHHFAALRITELAAGGDPVRSVVISAEDKTSPTPGFSPSPPKATLDDLKSLARRNNRMQREEILTLTGFLRDWYGIEYQPKIRPRTQALIDALEGAAPGDDFNRSFLENFSRHHFMLLNPVNRCLTGSELRHFALRQSCTQMWHSQTADIDEMRHELERHFNIVDFQPFDGNESME